MATNSADKSPAACSKCSPLLPGRVTRTDAAARLEARLGPRPTAGKRLPGRHQARRRDCQHAQGRQWGTETGAMGVQSRRHCEYCQAIRRRRPKSSACATDVSVVHHASSPGRGLLKLVGHLRADIGNLGTYLEDDLAAADCRSPRCAHRPGSSTMPSG